MAMSLRPVGRTDRLGQLGRIHFGPSDGGLMSRNVRRFVLVIAGAALLASPVKADHSFAAAFDENKPVAVTGVVTEIRLENPHSWFYVDVTDESGKVTKWGFEGN